MKTNRMAAPVPARPLAPASAVLVIAVMAHALMVGCGGKEQASNAANGSGTTAASPAPADATVPVTATTVAGDDAAGAKVYAARCALCHGPLGKGDGPAAAGLNPKPRNHTDGAYMNSRTDEQLLTVIRNGKGAMPKWGGILTEDEIHAVLKHVRSLAK